MSREQALPRVWLKGLSMSAVFDGKGRITHWTSVPMPFDCIVMGIIDNQRNVLVHSGESYGGELARKEDFYTVGFPVT